MRTIKIAPHTPTEIVVEELDSNRTRIFAYPFEAGYAVTVAHPLKRLLLGSSVGYAPTALRIDGVMHEFDSLRGMMEDVTLFIANLKSIRFKIKDDSLQKIVVDYHFAGPKVLYGNDLNTDELEVVTPEQYLATINENGNFNFSLVVEKGIGYVPSEDIRPLVPEGSSPRAASFPPVKQVPYASEKFLVEDAPTFEKIVLEIQTDGQIDPMSAFNNALNVMQKQLSVFNSEWNMGGAQYDALNDGKEIRDLLQKIETLNLSARSFNCLDRANIKYIGEIVLMTEAELKEVKNLGKKSTDEIKEKMEEIGYPIGGNNISPETLATLQKRLAKLK